MANIQFKREEIERHIPLNKKMLEAINLFGTPASLSSDVLEIEVFPNRPDLLSMHGFLRAFKAYLNKEAGLKTYKVYAPEKDYYVIIDPSVANIRPYTVCAIVKGLSFNDEKIKEVIDIQEKLHATLGRNRKKIAIGIYPLEKIKLPLRYEARKPQDIKFIPLDYNEEMSALKILQQHPTGRTYAHLLKGAETFPVFIDANNHILSLPPIINSNETGKITPSTKELFIECSGFDFPLLQKVINILATLFVDMGGKVYAMQLKYKKEIHITPDLAHQTMRLSLDHVNMLLGLSLKEKDVEKLLARMGYSYKKGKVKIPSWRVDILHEVDLIEDIAIAYGYNNLIPILPDITTVAEEAPRSSIKRKIAELLSCLKFNEISTYHLLKESEISTGEKIEVEDSKTEYKILRPNLLIPALRIFAENKDHEYPQHLFEIGTVFIKNAKSESGIHETEHLLIALCPGNFTEAKQVLNYLCSLLSLSFSLREVIKKEYIEGRAASIIVNNKILGSIGELHPETLRKANIKMPIAAIELSLDDLLAAMEKT